ncbi:MAG TPA: SRPBCC family protein [Burkholderiaceae bacterium]|nr:SRPBCC family protein [Burkholderiaceae bacterium]
MTPNRPATGPVVRKSVIVAAPLAVAFEVFTAQIQSWWPMASHHIGQADCAAVVIEPRAGGRWYERGVDGVECVWGQVLVWEAPRRVVLAWQLSAQFRFDPSIHTEVDVRFVGIDERTTRVELEHRGLEAYGAEAMAMRDAFSSPNGWNGMLDHYAQVAGRPVAAARP